MTKPFAISEQQQILEAAFDAAHLAACMLDMASGEMRWAGPSSEVLDLPVPDACATLPAFVELVHKPDREEFKKAFDASRADKGAFKHEFRLDGKKGELRWYSARGQFYFDANGAADRLLCVFQEIGDHKAPDSGLQDATAELKALNERLRVGMAESHHRVKNSLQNVISLLNLQVRKSGSLSADEVKKLSSLIHGLAVLHDLLNEQAREHGDVKSVCVDRIFERVVGIATRGIGSRSVESSFDQCEVTPRQASSLNVIFNELVSNAIKHGTGKLILSLENQGERAVLQVKDEGSQFAANFTPPQGGQTGLALLKLLCSSDLNCEPVFRNDDSNWAVVSVTFPVLQFRNGASAKPASAPVQ